MSPSALQEQRRRAPRTRHRAGLISKGPKRSREQLKTAPPALAIVAALRGRDPGRTTADVAERLAKQNLDDLTHRDRSVARTIAVGFDRLDDDARTLFLGLGLLPLPGFGLWTAAAILSGATADPAEVLLRLAGCHMIQPTGPAMRYRFHDLTRRYARHRADNAPTTRPEQPIANWSYNVCTAQC